jgi:arylsulfatase A-like enzyme
MDLGKGPTLDVLSVSLSTTDAVGHRYGPDSRELHDQVLRVDRALGRLIDSLYRMRDSTRVVFALGADHGVAPNPELHFPGTDKDRGRVDPRPVFDAARRGLAARGVDADALLFQSGMVTLDRKALAARSVNSDSVVTAMRSSLLKLPGVLRVDRPATLAAAAARGDKIARRWLHSVPPDLGVVLTLTLQPYYYWFTVRYATHGTPHDYDARIPILFMGPMFKPGRYGAAVRSVDIAPTLGAVTDIEPIEPLDGRVLTEALVVPRRTRIIPPNR